MKRTLLGTGILSWDGEERRTTRYGAVFLSRTSYNGLTSTEYEFDDSIARRMAGQRVRLLAKVVEVRPSGHVGDRFLKLKPKPKPVGTIIDLGIGTLRVLPAAVEDVPQIALIPEDGRDCFWLNPRRLYELHDQTVHLFAEPTKAKAPKPFAKSSRISDEIITFGDGTFQAQTKAHKFSIPPKVTQIGPKDIGTFKLEHARSAPAGTRIRIKPHS